MIQSRDSSVPKSSHHRNRSLKKNVRLLSQNRRRKKSIVRPESRQRGRSLELKKNLNNSIREMAKGRKRAKKMADFEEQFQGEIVSLFEKTNGEIYDGLDESRKHELLENCLKFVKEEESLDLNRMKTFTKLMINGIFKGIQMKNEEMVYVPAMTNITSLNKGNLTLICREKEDFIH
jgi:hypothetical protein